MNIIIDAQLPLALKLWLKTQDLDVIHVLDLPLKDRTPDIEVLKIAKSENRIIITKDKDFAVYKLIKNDDQKIIYITTGNIRNKELIKMFAENLDKIKELILTFEIVEINNHNIIVK